MAPQKHSKKNSAAKRKRTPSSSSSSASDKNSSSSSESSGNDAKLRVRTKSRKKQQDATRKKTEKLSDSKTSQQQLPTTPKKPRIIKPEADVVPALSVANLLDAARSINKLEDTKNSVSEVPNSNLRTPTKRVALTVLSSLKTHHNRQNINNNLSSNTDASGGMTLIEQLLLQKYQELKVTKVLVEEQRRDEEKRRRDRLTRNTHEIISATQVVRELEKKGALERVQQASGQQTRVFKKSSRLQANQSAVRPSQSDATTEPPTPDSSINGGSGTVSPALSRASSLSSYSVLSPAPSSSSSSYFNPLNALLPPDSPLPDAAPFTLDTHRTGMPPVQRGFTVFIKWKLANAFDEQRLSGALLSTCPGVVVKKISFGQAKSSAVVTLDSVASAEKVVADANGCMVSGVTIQVMWPRALNGSTGGMVRRENAPQSLKHLPKIARTETNNNNNNQQLQRNRSSTAMPTSRMGSSAAAAASSVKAAEPLLHMPLPFNANGRGMHEDRPATSSIAAQQRQPVVSYDEDAV